MTNTITRANSRRAALRRRLDARYPLFADQFYQQAIQRHRAYYQGQPVPAPAHPRRRRPARRPIDKKALAAFRACQLELLAWRHLSRAKVMARQIVAAVTGLIRSISVYAVRWSMSRWSVGKRCPASHAQAILKPM